MSSRRLTKLYEEMNKMIEGTQRRDGMLQVKLETLIRWRATVSGVNGDIHPEKEESPEEDLGTRHNTGGRMPWNQLRGAVHWPASEGSKPHFSVADSKFLRKRPEPGAPAGGEPTFDDTVLHFGTCCRSRHGSELEAAYRCSECKEPLTTMEVRNCNGMCRSHFAHTQEQTVREKLADYAHRAWAGWMRYLFEKSTEMPDGSVVIPVDSANRWRRQTKTPYPDLTEKEQQSDLAEADKMLAILNKEGP